MTLETVWAQLEQDLEWRQAEIRLLSNSRASLKKEDERNRFLRAELVMLYAHVEGFCKVAMLVYVKALNSRNVKRVAVCDELIASSLDDLFHALEYGDKKGKVFSSALPSDEKLHLIARRRDFVREFDSMLEEPLVLSDTTVNTESNLCAIVLRKNLFKLGFRADILSSYESGLDELAKRRHNIAHGIDDGVVRESDYERLQKVVYQAMDEFVLTIVESIEQESYLKPTGRPTAIDTLTLGEMR